MDNSAKNYDFEKKKNCPSFYSSNYKYFSPKLIEGRHLSFGRFHKMIRQITSELCQISHFPPLKIIKRSFRYINSLILYVCRVVWVI